MIAFLIHTFLLIDGPINRAQVTSRTSLGKPIVPIRVFSHDVTAAMLVFQTSPVGVEFDPFLCKRFLLFQ